MADLLSQANRLNDVEINNNAPVSSQTFRRVGSSINYLLDLTGAVNGDTNPSGPLGVILQPKETINFSWSAGNYAGNSITTLFSFQGTADRHLSWVEKSSGYCTTAFVGTASVKPDAVFDPVTRILNALLSQISSGGLGAGSRARITVNNITCGDVITESNGTINYITQNLFLRCAQAGTNTVRLVNPRPATQFTLTATSFTFEKIFV